MNNWQLTWTIVFFTAVTIFVLLAIVVSIGGAKDVKHMLQSLKENSQNKSDS